MSCVVLPILLIATAAAGTGAIAAVIGAAAGPMLLGEAFGIHVRPEPRLMIGAMGLVVWTGVGAVVAARTSDHGRPIRGTWANAAAFVRRVVSRLAMGTDVVSLERRTRRLTRAAASLWLLAATAGIAAAYLQFLFIDEMAAYQLGSAAYAVDIGRPEIQALSHQQRLDYSVQMARGLHGAHRVLFCLVTGCIGRRPQGHCSRSRSSERAAGSPSPRSAPNWPRRMCLGRRRRHSARDGPVEGLYSIGRYGHLS